MIATIILVITAQLSYYDPALCQDLPINCYDPYNPFSMASGRDARGYYGRGLACPQDFPLWSKWTLPGIRGDRHTPAGEWLCVDRGGMIVTSIDDYFRVRVVLDLLLPYRIVSGEVTAIYRGPVPQRLLDRIESEMMSRVYGGRN